MKATTVKPITKAKETKNSHKTKIIGGTSKKPITPTRVAKMKTSVKTTLKSTTSTVVTKAVVVTTWASTRDLELGNGWGCPPCCPADNCFADEISKGSWG